MNPDLTLTRDPAQLWPDPADCPDFPIVGRGSEPQPAWSREDAEARLRSLSRMVNPDGELREPTEAERAELVERYFKEPVRGTQTDPKLAAQGFPGLISNRSGEGFHIAEAVHLRGYLRKLAEHAAATNKAKEERELRALQSTVENFKTTAKALQAEAETLAEPARRYRQWEADKAADERLQMLVKHQLPDAHRHAARAAAELEIEAPELPDLSELIA